MWFMLRTVQRSTHSQKCAHKWGEYAMDVHRSSREVSPPAEDLTAVAGWMNDSGPGSADERAAALLVESVRVILICQETQNHWYLFLSKFWEISGSSRGLITFKAMHYLQLLCFGNPSNSLSKGYGFIVFLFCFALFFPLLHSNLIYFSGVKRWDLDLAPAEMKKHPGNIGCLLQFLCFQLQLYLVNTQNVFIYAGTSARS